MESNESDASTILASTETTEVQPLAAESFPEQPEKPVHPFAASFPMLEGEEMEALVDDLRRNGLQNPIVLDRAGQLIDGRNRLQACKLAGVQPTFTTLDTDPIAYILGANVNRRHLSKGQCAMAYAMAYPEPENGNGGRGKKNREVTSEFSGRFLQMARLVRRHAPDLAAKVMAGSSLEDAYKHAAEQKAEREEYERLRNQVRDGLDAIAAICARLKSDTEKPETAFLDQEDFVRAVRSEAKQILEHATELAENL